jgi:hypothetical protein
MLKGMKRGQGVIIMGMLTILISVGSSIYFYLQSTKQNNLVSTSANATSEELQQLILAVGEHYELPKGEQPRIATVSDVEQLSTEPFFARSRNGDKVLIFDSAKKAILYRPATDKIIEIAPFTQPAAEGQQEASGSAR